MIRKLLGIDKIVKEIQDNRKLARSEYNNYSRIAKKNRTEAKQTLAKIEYEMAVLDKKIKERKGE